jgi:hypothetical protein
MERRTAPAGTAHVRHDDGGNIMRHTLKAIFEKRSDAQHVLEKLLASGYKHDDKTPADTTRADIAPEDAGHDEGFGATLKHTFARMFGPKHQENRAPSEEDAANPQHVVIFTSESEPEAERAAGIIGGFGPNDVEERLEHADPDSAGAYLPGVAAMKTVYPPGTEPGALQFRAGDDSPYFGTQGADAPPAGNTYQHRMGSRPWPIPDKAAGDAAYRYGEEMRASDPAPERSWEEAEPSLQSGWERKRMRAGLPGWDRIREAVRRGWERVKH